MTFEDTIRETVAAAMAPLADRIRELSVEVERLRAALPTREVDVHEAARLLGCSVDTIRRRIDDGSIPIRRRGRLVRIDLASLRAPSRDAVASGLVQITDPR